jgi:hypothetical protein
MFHNRGVMGVFVDRLSMWLLLTMKDEAKFTMFRFDDFVKGKGSFPKLFPNFFSLCVNLTA